ncbi:CoA-binding protein [Tatumella sp. JGM130]|uniref:CoA-binding protein n=1 Tax=Tatumella sp. JGM130 TaxID=2799797 RepID=UPI001BAF38C6|nr:CoA-binding protein [Tatumella sp. JGM130]MBS0892453.1 CoA-binding protein [Tatumella sp. JGM130]
MNDSDIRKILTGTRRIALVGASDNPQRPAWQVMMFLLQHGYQVIPVSPRMAGKTVAGQQGYASLDEVPGSIDMVDVFRNPEVVPAIATRAIARQIPVLWLQPGTVNPQVVNIARQAGLIVVENKCTKIEINRLEIPPLPV